MPAPWQLVQVCAVTALWTMAVPANPPGTLVDLWQASHGAVPVGMCVEGSFTRAGTLVPGTPRYGPEVVPWQLTQPVLIPAWFMTPPLNSPGVAAAAIGVVGIV